MGVIKTAGICLLIFATVVGYGQKPAAAGNTRPVKIFSTAATLPLLKGVSTNPLLCIRIYVPGGNTGVGYRSINCSLSANAIKAFEKLEIYYTDKEPLFAANNLIATHTNFASKISIPVTIEMEPGWHYIWLSATLKADANINNKIEIHATGLTDVANKLQVISEQKPGYKKYTGIAVRRAGDDNVNSYRIPGITTTDKGTLIGVFDVRYKNSSDLPGNIDVGIRRSADGGASWQPMKIIMDMGAPDENNGIGDPSILFDPKTKKIWVAALWSKGNRSIAGSGPGITPDETGQFVVVSSNDDGLTWSAPQSITPQIKNPEWRLFFPGPGNGISMKDGKIVFPAQYWDANKMPHSTIVYSDDHGLSWKSGIGAKSNTTESQVVETTPGTLMLNMRDNRGRFRSVATTTSFGNSWVEHFTSYNTLPDPVCMGSLLKATVKVKGQLTEVLFFSNPNSASTRNDITIKASLDLGETWLPVNQLLLDERTGYGYSALTKIDDNTIGILYEGTRDLYFVRIPVTDIIK